jgi:Farnesoic acid 0-methyl transferase
LISRVSCEKGRVFNVSTISDYSYNQAWLTTTTVDHVVLQIKACRDPHILLSESIGLGPNSYEAAFGIIGNTKSVLREGPSGYNIVSVDTPGIMACDEFR